MAVVLHTTTGDLPVLLHCQACPLATFNFLALCASGYYDGCTFYRHFPGILLQTGDPTNTGKGGESIFARLPPVSEVSNSNDDDAVSVEAAAAAAVGVLQGRYFRDEGFGVTTHAQRGTLSMAHKGTKTDTNASQFFITTSPQPPFDGVYTAFGVVDLNGVYASADAAVTDATVDGEAVEAHAKSGDAVLRELEEAAADVDEKHFVRDATRVHIVGVTVLYNPFAEGKLKL